MCCGVMVCCGAVVVCCGVVVVWSGGGVLWSGGGVLWSGECVVCCCGWQLNINHLSKVFDGSSCLADDLAGMSLVDEESQLMLLSFSTP